MAVKCAYLLEGVICGEVTETMNSESSVVYQFKNPVLLQPSEKGIVLQHFLGIFVEDTVNVREADIRFGQLFSPVPEIEQYYNQQMHPSKIITPDSKIIT